MLMHIYFSIVNFQRVETEDGRTAGVQHQILEDGLSPNREVCHFFFYLTTPQTVAHVGSGADPD